jgi:hypothetical protein
VTANFYRYYIATPKVIFHIKFNFTVAGRNLWIQSGAILKEMLRNICTVLNFSDMLVE